LDNPLERAFFIALAGGLIETTVHLSRPIVSGPALYSAHPNQDHPTGWRPYLYSTNHKDIGTMYLVFALAAGTVGAGFSILMRADLQEPGLQIFSQPHYYNVVVSAHGLTMIFFVLMPGLIESFGN
jgi:cytochrome c oxidase subunit I